MRYTSTLTSENEKGKEIGLDRSETREPWTAAMLYEEETMLWEQTKVLANLLYIATCGERSTMLRNMRRILIRISPELRVKEEWKEIVEEEGTKTAENKEEGSSEDAIENVEHEDVKTELDAEKGQTDEYEVGPNKSLCNCVVQSIPHL